MKLQSFFFIVPPTTGFSKAYNYKHNVSTQLGQIKISRCCFYLKPFCSSSTWLARHSMFAMFFFLAHLFLSKRLIFTTPFETRPRNKKRKRRTHVRHFFHRCNNYSAPRCFAPHNSRRKSPRISLNSPLNLGINHGGEKCVLCIIPQEVQHNRERIFIF